jgi:inorganic pyrophosphatase
MHDNQANYLLDETKACLNKLKALAEKYQMAFEYARGIEDAIKEVEECIKNQENLLTGP